MEKHPLVSIITPLFNRITLIEEAINSVISQTYTHWELIVVDDGSNDGSFSYLERAAKKESRIRPYQRERDPKGAATCRNIALSKAKGDFVIFLDSDDLLAPKCLEQRVSLFESHNQYDFLVFPIQYFDYKPGDRQDLFFRDFHEDYLTSFLFKSYWITLSPIWKIEALKKLDGFDENLACMQDSDLHMRAILYPLEFKVFKEESLVDGYLRVSNDHTRISNSISSKKLNSKIRVIKKIFNRLKDLKAVDSNRKNMIAAQYLNISWNYYLVGEQKKAFDLWLSAYHENIVKRWQYAIGYSFIVIRGLPIVRHSRLIAGAIKKVYQLVLPGFLLKL